MKAVWGCEKDSILPVPVMEEIEGSIKYEFTRCPKLYLSESIINLDNLLFDIEELKILMPDYEEISPRFLLARRYLKQKISEYKLEIALRDRKNG